MPTHDPTEIEDEREDRAANNATISPRLPGGRCRICGCTDDNCLGCHLETGAPCYWVNAERDVCSACAGAHEART